MVRSKGEGGWGWRETWVTEVQEWLEDQKQEKKEEDEDEHAEKDNE